MTEDSPESADPWLDAALSQLDPPHIPMEVSARIVDALAVESETRSAAAAGVAPIAPRRRRWIWAAAGVAAAAAGLSMALGAFIAGLLLSETEFRKAIETTIGPFKGLLLGVFFFHEAFDTAKAIGFAALDSKAAIPLLKKAQAAKIPVVAFDSGVDSDIPVTTATNTSAEYLMAAW